MENFIITVTLGLLIILIIIVLKYTKLVNSVSELNKIIAEKSAYIGFLEISIKNEKQVSATIISEKNNLLLEEKVSILRISELTSENKTLSTSLSGQKNEIERIQKEMKSEFENIANKILEENSKRFSNTNKESIDNILKPLGESIFDFKNQIKTNLTEETKQRSTLQEQVKTLVEQTNSVTKQAENLVSALKGKSKIRGNWGELVLESVLQQAGMAEGREYNRQVTVKDEDTKSNFFPDIIINLPNNKKIIIDSKVSLVDYENYSTFEDSILQDEALKKHISSVKNHIDSLSSKEYNKKIDNSTNFTMMFIPIEPAYMAAIEKDGLLWEYAYKRNVMLVSPSNLLPCLKLINDMWNKELITQNANKIVKRGEKLYNQLRLVMESFNRVGDALNKAQNEFVSTKSRLVEGTGNLIWQAEMLCSLGVKPKSQIPEGESIILPNTIETTDISEVADIE